MAKVHDVAAYIYHRKIALRRRHEVAKASVLFSGVVARVG